MEYDWSVLVDPLVVIWDGWRCSTVDSGAQFVMIPGTLKKLEWPAGKNMPFLNHLHALSFIHDTECL